MGNRHDYGNVCGSVIIGKVPSITNVTFRLVPIMAVLYIAMSIIILLVNIKDIPTALSSIFSGAFSSEGVTAVSLEP